MKKLKKLTSLSLALLMILNTFLPITVLALNTEGGIVLSFNVNHDGHTATVQDGHLRIDGNFVDPKNITSENYEVACNNNACTMSFDNQIQSVQLNIEGLNAFSLRAQGQIIDSNTTFTSSENIAIENPVNTNNNNNNNNQNTQPFTYDETKLSMTITLNMSTNMPNNYEFETNSINTQLTVTDGNQHSFLGIETGSHSNVQQQDIYVTLSNNNKTATIKIYNNNNGIMLSRSGDSIFDIDNYSGSFDLITQDTTLTISEREQEAPFDGKVLLIWQCGEETCKHEFNLTNPQQMTYVLDSTIKDDADDQLVFDLKKALNGESKAAYVLPSDLEAWETLYTQTHSNYDFRTVDIDLLLDGRMREIEEQYEQNGICEHTGNPGEFEQCIDNHAHPTIVDRGLAARLSNGQEMGANSHIAYGDNVFKITVYTDDYVGLKEDESTYNYRRERFETMYSESKDISGTTKENPYVLDTLLIERKTIISSNNINGVEFKEVKALDVPGRRTIRFYK